MNDDVATALRNIVERSKTPGEMERRVVETMGKDKVPQAVHIALELKGRPWLLSYRRGGHTDIETTRGWAVGWAIGRATGVLLRAPSLWVLLVGSGGLLAVLLYPPYLLPLADGYVHNAGFSWLWQPPVHGNLSAIVNTPLLAVLVAGATVLTGCVYWLFRRIELTLAEHE